MAFLRRTLGVDRPASPQLPVEPAAPLPEVAVGETASVRRIATRLSARQPAEARRLAAFAYLLGRAAHADLGVSDAERDEMRRLVAEVGGVPAGDADLVVDLASTLASRDGATEDFLVAREFRAISVPEERLSLLRCCMLVMAADDAIGAEEAWLVGRLAEELDVPRPDLNRVRAEFHDRYTAIRLIRREAGRLDE